MFHARCWIAVVLLMLVGATVGAQESAPAPEENGSAEVSEDDSAVFFQLEGTWSLLTDAPDRSVFAASRGATLRGGFHWTNWGVFGQVGQSRWLTSEVNNVLTDGVLNVGVGADYRFFDDRVIVSLSTGTSTLLFDTLLDQKGTTGYFVDVRPGGLRWFPLDWMTLEFHPLSYTLMVPVVTTPRLVNIIYRLAFVVEITL